MDPSTAQNLRQQINNWAMSLGFAQLGVSDTELSQAENYLSAWLHNGYQGEMHWMAKHGLKRSRPDALVPGTIRVISVRMNYWLGDDDQAWQILQNPQQAYVSRYALGRDYHKVLRRRLQQLVDKIQQAVGEFGYRVFVDSAPVLEKPLAQKAGLGWIGKHTNLIHRDAGSYFFLGEIYTDLPLPIDEQQSEDHCGTCQACIDSCPTQAILGPYELDARRCISYLTIELRGSIPLALRPMIGNRIYGCDDCQLVCPWNRFAQMTQEPDFTPRHQLDDITLVELFGWDEAVFLRHTEGSPIRRIGYECWLRNIAVALGNAPTSAVVIKALQTRIHSDSDLVREHVQWALEQHGALRP